MSANAYTFDAETVVLPRRRFSVREYVCDGETVLFDPTTWRTCVLNATACDVWNRCDGHTTMWELAQTQVDDYAVDFDTALDHVRQVAALLATMEFFVAEAPDATLIR